MYSAVRVGGKHLYTYARAGETVEVPARTVCIRELAVEAVDLRAMSVTFRVACSKGTYIRTICQDVGAALGTGAYMADLVRLQSGPFRLEDAVSLETLEAAKDAADAEPEGSGPRWLTPYLQPADMPLARFGKALVPAEAARRFADGRQIPLSDCRIVRRPAFDTYPPGWPVREEYRRAFCLYRERTDGGETFLGVAFCDPDGLYMAPDKVFVQRAAGGQA